MSSSTNTRGRSKRKTVKPPKKHTRVLFDSQNSEHMNMLHNSVSDDESKVPATRNPSTGSTPKKSKKVIKSGKKKGLDKTTILFGEDEDIDPSELDEKGNIKDLIDYSDEKDYAVYQYHMKLRDRKEQKMASRPHLIFTQSSKEEEDGDEDYEEQEEFDEENDEEDEEDCEEEEIDEDEAPLGFLIPYLMGERLDDPLSRLQARVMASNLPQNYKESTLKRIENGDPDKPKLIEYVESLLSIPWGKYAITPITLADPQEKIRAFFDESIRNFDSAIYGLQNVKQEIINYLAQFITAGPNAEPRILALYGPAGVGKTLFARHGIANVLGRPLKAINMGGIKDSVHMTGFDYSYSSSRYGAVVHCLIDKGVMNPVIVLEEIDKISTTRDGQDIQRVLMHLIDPEQNTEFQDKYFQGINIDMSKVIFVCTLNDPKLLDPILLNRLHLIKVETPTTRDKIEIARRHMLPLLCKKIGIDPTSVIIPDSVHNYILGHYCQGDEGLRTFKRALETIILRLNTIKLVGKDPIGKLQVSFPLTIDSQIVNSIITIPERSDAVLNMFG